MKTAFSLIAVAMLFTSTSAYAYIGHSKSYKVESDFGITGPSKLVVFPRALRLETKDAHFLVPLASVDYTLLENTTLKVSVRGKVITIKIKSRASAESLNKDLTGSILGEYD